MAKNDNSSLGRAKKQKNDEFYTRRADVELELAHYKEHFRGKTVLCNCDDPRVSSFFHYFSHQFERLGLKRLVTTCYKSQDMDLFSRQECERAVWLEYLGDKNGNRVPDPEEIGIRNLNGDGDFRSEECIELLKQADIVVTNPPFSLFREYVAQLVKYGKKFLILGNKNAIKYKEIFPLIASNQLWIGTTPMSHEMYFDVPRSFIDESLAQKKDRTIVKVDGKYMARSQAIWFTNLDHSARHDEMILWKEYTPEEYPTYVNYDAIEVSKTSEIPKDYDGKMGVPITFLDKYNPDQFEIVGMSLELAEARDKIRDWYLARPEEKQKRTGNDAFYIERGGTLLRLYDRIVIRRRK